MLIAVPGSSDLGGVLGVSTANPEALLRAIRDRFGPFRHRHVLVLSPHQLAATAREQAHVVIASDPAVRVCVLPLRHHGLTLSLIGRSVLGTELRPDGWTDPGQAVQLVHSIAARSRSLIWHPSLGSVEEPHPSLGERLAGLLPARSYFHELGSPGLLPARSGPGGPSPYGWHVAGSPSAQLRTSLGGVQLEPVDLSLAGRRPYAGRRSVEITQLAPPYARPLDGPTCGSCTATLVGSLCAFCGCGPTGAPRPGEASPELVQAERGVRI